MLDSHLPKAILPFVIYSFDIFDTLITRITGTPAGIFNLMQKEIRARGIPLSEDQISDFRNLRIYSEQEAYADKWPVEITLDDIYKRLGECLQTKAATIDELKALEIDCEVRSVFPIDQNLRTFFEAVNQGRRVILVSDMYLPRSAIKKILDRADSAIYSSATLYLSSEIGMTKRSGALFKFIAESEGVKFSDIWHTGDNLNSDYWGPKRLGIKANHIDLAKLRRWEKLGVLSQADGCAAAGGLRRRHRRSAETLVNYPELASESLSYWEMTSGLSKKARLSGAPANYLLGYSLAGPILVPFAYWVLTEASRRKIDRLYFVARDGQIFLKIANALQKRGVSSNVELRYLYGSRRAWHLPSFGGFDDHDLFWIIDSRHGLSLNKLATRLGLEVRQLLLLLEDDPEGRRLIKPPDAVLSQAEIALLSKILQTNVQINEAVESVATIARRNLAEYFNQEGLSEEKAHLALVDIGWSGRSQDSLSRALNAGNSGQSIVGFYFGLHGQTNLTNDQNAKIPFAVHPHHFKSSPNGKQFFQVIHVLECLTAADHGATVCYERHGNVIAPRLDEQGNSVAKWGLAEYQQGILDFANDISIDNELLDTGAVRLRLRDLRNYLFEDYPEIEIAHALGSYPFTPEMDGAGQAEFGPALSVLKSMRFHAIPPSRKTAISAWVHGSYVRSGLVSKIVLSKISRLVFGSILHPIHTAIVGTRILARRAPPAVRARARSLIPNQHFEKLQIFVQERRARKKA